MPARLVIALAAFIRLYRGDWHGRPIPLNDDPQVLAWFAAAWAEAESTEALVQRVLSKAELWDRDLTALPGLASQISDCLRKIEAGEIIDMLKQAAQ